MLKGINRYVIEVTKTDNIYYERAILIVRPEFAEEERRVLEKEARKMLKEMNAPSIIRNKKQIIKHLLWLSGAVLLGAFVSAVVTNLI